MTQGESPDDTAAAAAPPPPARRRPQPLSLDSPATADEETPLAASSQVRRPSLNDAEEEPIAPPADDFDFSMSTEEFYSRRSIRVPPAPEMGFFRFRYGFRWFANGFL